MNQPVAGKAPARRGPRPTGWSYRDVPVLVWSLRGIAPVLRPQGDRAGMVQAALDELEPWRKGEDPIQEYELDQGWIRPAAVGIQPGESIVWGVRRGHTYTARLRTIPLSPFTARQTQPVRIITIELSGTPEMPVISRAYGGEFTPSLPGTGSARRSGESAQAVKAYWRSHARPLEAMAPGSESPAPPCWYDDVYPPEVWLADPEAANDRKLRCPACGRPWSGHDESR